MPLPDASELYGATFLCRCRDDPSVYSVGKPATCPAPPVEEEGGFPWWLLVLLFPFLCAVVVGILVWKRAHPATITMDEFMVDLVEAPQEECFAVSPRNRSFASKTGSISPAFSPAEEIRV
ncbi:hypothetical protein DIPPA_25089 [Diplonema papillatum]|nr:hypothetical protein DIPPA_25089 [Diplonema papillatum]